MTSHATTGERPARAVRLAILAGALAMIGCFSAAFTFSGHTAEAAEPQHGSMIQPGR
ncbi:hypothetical protein [Pelagerythrobacter sp.]|uniref:hypothetical protein n=1 Tax=Pelagerythrobacter sp. TaxID=2800702 RepID=UPI0035B3E250